MLEQGVIKLACFGWGSPIVFAPKVDGTVRFCVNYQKVNAMIIKHVYPIPRMDESIDRLNEDQVLTSLDCNSSYWQVPNDEEDREKTA